MVGKELIGGGGGGGVVREDVRIVVGGEVEVLESKGFVGFVRRKEGVRV